MAYLKSRNPEGRPTDYGEPKTRVNFSLTKTCVTRLDEYAQTVGCSRSELIERIARQIGLDLIRDTLLTEEDSKAQQMTIPVQISERSLAS